MKKIKNDKIIIVSDLHQNIGYVDYILKHEQNFDKIVFIGDYFDTFLTPDNSYIYSFKNTCKWINQYFHKLGEKAVWLVGNHDISYIASYQLNKTDCIFPFVCSGWTKSKQSDFNYYIDQDWMKNIGLCCQVGDYIVSHAGFHPNHFQPFKSESENIQDFDKKWEDTKQTFAFNGNHFIGQVGVCRGGKDKVGSPVWLDWDREFEPLEETKQIVGHTIGYNYRVKKNKNGLSNYNIDTDQNCYAVWKDGKLEVINI